jgi:hypothetical protein
MCLSIREELVGKVPVNNALCPDTGEGSDQAKVRLSSFLSPTERYTLATAMLDDACACGKPRRSNASP